MARRSIFATLFAPLLARFAPKAKAYPKVSPRMAEAFGSASASKGLFGSLQEACPNCGEPTTVRCFVRIDGWICDNCYREYKELADLAAVSQTKEMTVEEFRRRYRA